IRVNCLAPGLLEGGLGRNLPEHRLADYLKHCALGRVGTFAEVARLAAFMVSPANGYMSGETLLMDGGGWWTAYAPTRPNVTPGLGRFLELSGRDARSVRARGCVLKDADGEAWDDWIAGFGALNLGHTPAAIKQAIAEHLAGDAPGLYVESLNPLAGELA